MFKPKIVDQVNERVNELLVNNPFIDIEKNLKTIVLSIFSKLDLVTREEFEIQQKVLIKTREKVEELEKQVEELLANRE